MVTVRDIFTEAIKGQEEKKERMAQCKFCNRLRKSSEHEMLAFFQEHPEREYDSFYCGCIGWD